MTERQSDQPRVSSVDEMNARFRPASSPCCKARVDVRHAADSYGSNSYLVCSACRSVVSDAAYMNALIQELNDARAALATAEQRCAELDAMREWSSKAVEFVAAVGMDEQSEHAADDLVVEHAAIWGRLREGVRP